MSTLPRQAQDTHYPFVWLIHHVFAHITALSFRMMHHNWLNLLPTISLCTILCRGLGLNEWVATALPLNCPVRGKAAEDYAANPTGRAYCYLPLPITTGLHVRTATPPPTVLQ